MFGTLVRVVAVCTLCALATAGQNFSVPSTWRKPTSTLPRASRELLASAVVDTMSTRFTSGQVQDAIYDESAYLLTAIARTDYLSGNTSYRNLVLDNVQAQFQAAPGIANYNVRCWGYSPSILAWGLAAINAHLAYNDSQSLPLAISVWDQMIAYQIQPSDAVQGFVVAQSNVSIPSSCNGTSVAGGVFGAVGSTSTGVDAPTVAAFMALSGHLYEVTSDSKYLAAAELAAQFIQAHMVSGPIIVNDYLVGACSINSGSGPMIWDSAFTIWGLSILATHNGTWTTLLNSLILSGVPSNYWTNPTDGVLIELQGDLTPNSDMQRSLKAVFIRGLQEAWMRADPNSDVATYLKSFLLVQFNALQDLATVPGSNIYSPVWTGPPQPDLIEWGQLCALDVLNSAFAVEPNNDDSSRTNSTTSSGLTDSLPATTGSATLSSSTLPRPTPTVAAIPVSRTKSSTAAIMVGAIIGGVSSFLIFLGLLVFLRRRQTRRRRDRRTHAPHWVSDLVEPYMLSSLPESGLPEASRHPEDKASLPVSRSPEVDTDPAAVRPSPTHAMVQETPAVNADPLPLPLMIAQLSRRLERYIVPARSFHEEGPPSYRE